MYYTEVKYKNVFPQMKRKKSKSRDFQIFRFTGAY